MHDRIDDDLVAYLELLAASGPATAWLEIRELRSAGEARRRFVPTRRAAAAVADIRRAAHHADVFVGAAPRTRPRGDRTGIDNAAIVWAECDDPSSARRATSWSVLPSIVIRSGSPGRVHAYWLLDRPLPTEALERANRRLVHALGADPASADATRMLRPPGTLNHKHDPPASVTLVRLSDERHQPGDLLGALPDPPPSPPAVPSPTRPVVMSDPLRHVPPAVYVERILGQAVPRSRKLICPFHDDTRPSLHVYATPDRGWFCFGCRRGGSVYDLAAAAWGIPARGPAFLELRARLRAILAGATRAG
jgi:hypothetical protein